MTCRICHQLIIKDYSDVTRVLTKYDTFTRGDKRKIITVPHEWAHIKSKKLFDQRCYHNQMQYFGVMSEDEIVVLAKCGHLFHKGCIRRYVTTSKKPMKQPEVMDCPACNEKIILTNAIIIDIKIHNGLTKTTDKLLKNANYMNMELHEQIEKYQKAIIPSEDAIEQVFHEIEEVALESERFDRELACQDILEKDYYEMLASLEEQRMIVRSSQEEIEKLFKIYENVRDREIQMEDEDIVEDINTAEVLNTANDVYASEGANIAEDVNTTEDVGTPESENVDTTETENVHTTEDVDTTEDVNIVEDEDTTEDEDTVEENLITGVQAQAVPNDLPNSIGYLFNYQQHSSCEPPYYDPLEYMRRLDESRQQEIQLNIARRKRLSARRNLP